jgi:hypothetical protein
VDRVLRAQVALEMARGDLAGEQADLGRRAKVDLGPQAQVVVAPAQAEQEAPDQEDQQLQAQAVEQPDRVPRPKAERREAGPGARLERAAARAAARHPL